MLREYSRFIGIRASIKMRKTGNGKVSVFRRNKMRISIKLSRSSTSLLASEVSHSCYLSMSTSFRVL